MPKMLSPHFALDEFLVSQEAVRRGIDNSPDATVRANLVRLAGTLEQVRAALGDVPIVISSGYRCPALNKAIGGAANSAHILGLAVDFTAPSYGTVLATARAIKQSGIAFDQLIYEYGRWVHLGLSVGTPRQQLLSIFDAGQYLDGLRSA